MQLNLRYIQMLGRLNLCVFPIVIKKILNGFALEDKNKPLKC